MQRCSDAAADGADLGSLDGLSVCDDCFESESSTTDGGEGESAGVDGRPSSPARCAAWTHCALSEAGQSPPVQRRQLRADLRCRRRILRSVSYQEVASHLRPPVLEVTKCSGVPAGFARVRLHAENMPREHRGWWQESMSELSADGCQYLSSKKARRLMEQMFNSLQIAVEPDHRSMALVDSCLADYRGLPSYLKEVKVRGPAVTVKLTQQDDRSLIRLPCLQTGTGFWIFLCFRVMFLIPFCIWIFLTGGAWPVRKCTGGACCSVYYFVSLLTPMAFVLPITELVLFANHSRIDPDAIYLLALVSYVVLSALAGSLFVCVSQGFFKLPTIFYGDFVTALACPSWPNDADNFKTRSRLWPERAVVDELVSRGCHLVPKPPANCGCFDVNGSAACHEAHLLWRFSFSQAEVTLSKHIPEHYRRSYITLKWLMKKYIIKASESLSDTSNSYMRSYYLKTVLFWELELAGQLKPEHGCEELVLCMLAQRLQRCIQQRHLAHFFIPDVNLLEELTDADFENIERLLEKVIDNPAPLINTVGLMALFLGIGCCETLFCTPGRDYRGAVCCNYATRLPYVW